MVPSIALVFLLVSPAFTLPFSTQDYVTTGIQGSPTVQNYEKYTDVDAVKPVITNVETENQHQEKYVEAQNVRPVQTQGQKSEGQVLTGVYTNERYTGVENVKPIPSNVERTGVQGYQTGYTGEKCSGIEPVNPISTNLEKTGVQGSTQFHESTATPVSTYLGRSGVENLPETHQVGAQTVNKPVYDEKVQQNYPENQPIVPVPVSGGVQPLSVLPVVQAFPAGPIVNPVVVTETIADRVVLVPVEPIRQGNYQSEPNNFGYSSEKQFAHQQQQPSNINYTPVQNQENEPNQQLYNSQPDVSSNPGYKNPEKQVPYQQVTQGSQVSYQQLSQENQQVPTSYNPVEVQKTQVTQQGYTNEQQNPTVQTSKGVAKQLPLQSVQQIQPAQPSNVGYQNQNQGAETNQQLFSVPTPNYVPNKFENVPYKPSTQEVNQETPDQFPRTQETQGHYQQGVRNSEVTNHRPQNVEKESTSQQSVQPSYNPIVNYQSVPHSEEPSVRPFSTQQQIATTQ